VGFESGMLVHVSGDEAWDEPEEIPPADAGDNDQEGGQERPEGPAFRIAAAFESVEVPSGPQHQLAEEFARSLAPHLEAIQLQQQITENLVNSLDGFEQVQKQLLGITEPPGMIDLQQQFAESIAKNLGPHLEVFRDFARLAVPPLIKLNIPTDWYPSNWGEVPDIGSVVGITLDEGVPLVWVPRAAIVAELVAAPDADARDGLLISLLDEIAEDCTAVLSEITAPELRPLGEIAVDAVAALRCGHGPSAQALAGNVFDTLLRDATRRGVIFAGPPAGYFKYDKVRKKITPVSEQIAVGRFRTACVLSAALPALENYDPADPVPARFVRHATAHSARPEQYTPVNAIVAVMLMVSTLREAQAPGW